MNNHTIIGVDIGGTKCAVTLSFEKSGEISLVDKTRFATYATPQETIHELFNSIENLIEKHRPVRVDCIGISCGGPLNGKKGLIICPPNLPDWVNIPIVEMFQKRFGIPAALKNDANAGVLAEWLWGAARGLENVVFLTFGTGMGAGLILNRRLYEGTNDLAGEVGHIRIENDGPVGFGKAGSFEGFCSGGGITRLGQTMIARWLSEKKDMGFVTNFAQLDNLTAHAIGEAAQAGNRYALEIFNVMSRKLGKGLSIIIDILNPQMIVLGSIYGRQKNIIVPIMEEVLREEAIGLSLEACKIVPAQLGEAIGDYAAAAIAVYHLDQSEITKVI